MDPIKLRVTRILDFGTIVSIVGTDIDSNEPIVVHVDHRPFQLIWAAWRLAGFSQPITFDADRLTLALAIVPDEDGAPEIIDAPAA